MLFNHVLVTRLKVKLCTTVDTNMELVPNSGSDRAWVWTTFADFAEGQAREELLALRFINSESKFFIILFLIRLELFFINTFLVLTH